MPNRTSPTLSQPWSRLVGRMRAYGVFTMDPTGVIDSWNEGIACLLGYQADEFVGRSAAMLFTPDDRDADMHAREMQAALERGEAQDNRWHVHKDGTRVWVNGTMTPVYAPDGRLAGFMKVMRDETEARITARRLERRAREHAALLDLGSYALKHPDADDLFQHGARCISDTLRNHHVHLYAADDGDVHLRGAVGDLGAERLEAVRHEFEASSATRALGDVVDEAAVQSGPDLAPSLARQGIQSRIHVRIPGLDGPIGSIEALSDEAEAFDPEDVRFVRSVANLLGPAVAQRRLRDALAHKADHDPLTGLPNRLLFETRLEEALARASRQDERVAVLFFDVDRFKEINDAWGHHVGDALLQAIGGRAQEAVRAWDTAGRMGGDEFAVFLPTVRDRDELAHVCTRLLQAFRDPFTIEQAQVEVTTTIGVSLYPEDGADPATLLRVADQAMYEGKAQGRNTYHVREGRGRPAGPGAGARGADLRQAIANGEIRTRCAPFLDVARDRIDRVEVELWWDHPRHGSLRADPFFTSSEDIGAVREVGTWALERACAHLRQWSEAVATPPRVALAIPQALFVGANFPVTCASTAAEAGVRPDRVELWIDEHTVRHASDVAGRHVEALRDVGFRIGVYDVGSGDVPLRQLVSLAADVIAVATCLTSHLEGPEAQLNRALLRAIAEGAAATRTPLVARDVEAAEQFEALRELGVSAMSGPAAMPATEGHAIVDVLRAREHLGTRGKAAPGESAP